MLAGLGNRGQEFLGEFDVGRIVGNRAGSLASWRTPRRDGETKAPPEGCPGRVTRSQPCSNRPAAGWHWRSRTAKRRHRCARSMPRGNFPAAPGDAEKLRRNLPGGAFPCPSALSELVGRNYSLSPNTSRQIFLAGPGKSATKICNSLPGTSKTAVSGRIGTASPIARGNDTPPSVTTRSIKTRPPGGGISLAITLILEYSRTSRLGPICIGPGPGPTLIVPVSYTR